jgi:hypothetical protein
MATSRPHGDSREPSDVPRTAATLNIRAHTGSRCVGALPLAPGVPDR